MTRKGSNSNGLVLPLGQSHHVVDHGTAGRVGWLASGLEEPGVDPLTDDNVGELQLLLVDPSHTETILGKEKYHEEENHSRLAHLDGLELVVHHVVDLTVTDSVPVEDDPGWKLSVDVLEPSEHLGDAGEEVIVQLLGGVGVHISTRHPLGEGLIHRGHHGPHTPPLLSRVMVGVVPDDHGVLNIMS